MNSLFDINGWCSFFELGGFNPPSISQNNTKIVIQVPSFSFASAHWQLKNIQAKRFFPSLLHKASVSTELLQVKRFAEMKIWLAAFVAQAGLTSKQALDDALDLYLKKKGCCHGLCTFLVKHRLESEKKHLHNLIPLMIKNHREDVIYFQLLECLRAHFSLVAESKESQDISKLIAKVVPPLKNFEHFFYEKNVHDKISSFLLRNNEILALVRVWNSKEKTGHSLLFISSDASHEYVFFNSSNAALYQYPNQKSLVKSFIQHVVAHIPSVDKQGGTWRIELY